MALRSTIRGSFAMLGAPHGNKKPERNTTISAL